MSKTIVEVSHKPLFVLAHFRILEIFLFIELYMCNCSQVASQLDWNIVKKSVRGCDTLFDFMCGRHKATQNRVTWQANCRKSSMLTKWAT